MLIGWGRHPRKIKLYKSTVFPPHPVASLFSSLPSSPATPQSHPIPQGSRLGLLQTFLGCRQFDSDYNLISILPSTWTIALSLLPLHAIAGNISQLYTHIHSCGNLRLLLTPPDWRILLPGFYTFRTIVSLVLSIGTKALSLSSTQVASAITTWIPASNLLAARGVMESLPEQNINTIGSTPMHTSSPTKVLSQSYHYQEYEVTSGRFIIPITSPGTYHYSPSSSSAFSPDHFAIEQTYSRQSPCPLEQPTIAPVPSIRDIDDKYSDHVSYRPLAEHLPSTHLSKLPGHVHSRHAQAVARTSICSSSPDRLLQYRYPSSTSGETHSALSPMPGYVTSYHYKDFVLYRDVDCDHNCGEHCYHRQSTSTQAHGTSSTQPPRAPYIGRLATPEFGEKGICSRSTHSMDRLAWEYKYIGYEEDEWGCLPPVREGMFPDL